MSFLSTKHKSLQILALGIVALILGLTTYKLIAYSYFLSISAHYKSYIPLSFDIQKTVFAGDRIGGFIEGCGVAVFELTENTSAKISEGGIAFLNKNSTTQESEHSQYMDWQETPLTVQGQYHLFQELVNEDAGGNTCVDLPEALKKDISSAISKQGAYYSGLNQHTELLLIPALHLAVFSHDR